MDTLRIEEIRDLTNDRLGVFDVACPVCGPERKSRKNRKRQVLRIWRKEPGFASYHCARCNLSGYVRERGIKRWLC